MTLLDTHMQPTERTHLRVTPNIIHFISRVGFSVDMGLAMRKRIQRRLITKFSNTQRTTTSK